MKDLLKRRGKRANSANDPLQHYYSDALQLDTRRFLELATAHAREILDGRAVDPHLLREAEDTAAEIAEHSRSLREQLGAEMGTRACSG